MTVEEYEELPVGTIIGQYMKIKIPDRQFTTDCVVDLTTGEVKHWSNYLYEPREKRESC